MARSRSITVLAGLSLAIAACGTTSVSSQGVPSPGSTSAGPSASDVSASSTPTSSPAAAVQLRFATLPGPGEQANAKAWVEAYAKTQPSVTAVIEPQEGDNYFQKLTLQAASGTLPDIVWLPALQVKAFAEKRILLDLSQCLADNHLDTEDIYPSMLALGQFQGRQYMVPRDYNHLVTYYNADMFSKAGIALPTNDWTWEDAVAAARSLTVKDASGKTTQYGIQGDNFDWWAVAVPAIRGFGGDVISSTGDIVVDSDEAAKGIDALYQLVKDGIATNEFEQPVETVANGTAAMTFGVRPAVSGIEEEVAGKFKWDAVAFPKFPTKRSVGTGTSGYAVAATSKHPQEACQLLSFIDSTPGQQVFSKTGNAVPVLKSLASDPGWRSVPRPDFNQDAFTAFPEGDTLNLETQLPAAAGPPVETALSELMEKVLLGQITPRAMVTEWAVRIQDAITSAS